MQRIHPVTKPQHPYPVSDLRLINGTLIVTCHDDTSGNRFCAKLQQSFLVANLENIEIPKFNYNQSKEDKKTIKITAGDKNKKDLNLTSILKLLETVKLISPADHPTFLKNLSTNHSEVLTIKPSNA